MSIKANEMFGPTVSRGDLPRAAAAQDGVVTGRIAAVSPAVALARLTPLAFDEANGKYVVWSAGAELAVQEVQTYTLGAPTGGTYKLSFDGQQTTALAFNLNAAGVQTALEALSNIAAASADIVVSGGPSNSGAIVITFVSSGAFGGKDVPAIQIDPTLLTGSTSANPTVATTTTQGAAGSGLNTIAGFLWVDDFVTDATQDQLAEVLIYGTVHRDDVPVPTGESQSDLDEALRTQMREKGVMVQGITGFH